MSRPLDTILITHAHIDHVAGVASILAAYPGAKVYALEDGVPLMAAEDIPTLIDTILPLGDAITVYPGHGRTTTIGRERTANPFILDALAGGG